MIEAIRHIEQYDGPWLMHGPTLKERIQQINAMDLSGHIQARMVEMESRSAMDEDRYEMVGDIAVISIEGAMTKYGSSLSSAKSSVDLRRSVRAAASDDGVKGILLRIDSPGGAVAGTSDLAEDVAAAGKIKPVHAFIEDTGASAAYWIASQASRVTANRSAMVGSIGTYAYLIDSSGLAEKQGLTVHEIKSTPLKGTGIAPGAEITDEQIENLNRELGEVNAEFLSAVQRGRGFTDEQLAAVSDARVHVGDRAVAFGLIDTVGTLDEAIQAISGDSTVLSSEPMGLTSLKDKAMKNRSGLVKPYATEEVDEEVAEDEIEEEATEDEEVEEEATDEEDDEPTASVAELKAQIPDSNAEFREQCIERGYTLTQAKDHWTDHLRAQLESRTAERDAMPKSRSVGVMRLTSRSASKSASSPAELIAKLRADKIAAGVPRHKAHAQVMRENPDLRDAYVAAKN